jgi:hypothetical protein
VNVDHGGDVFLWSVPALPDQSVVKLLGGWVFPSGRVVPGDGRERAVGGEMGGLEGCGGLGEGRDLVERIDGTGGVLVLDGRTVLRARLTHGPGDHEARDADEDSDDVARQRDLCFPRCRLVADPMTSLLVDTQRS